MDVTTTAKAVAASVMPAQSWAMYWWSWLLFFLTWWPITTSSIIAMLVVLCCCVTMPYAEERIRFADVDTKKEKDMMLLNGETKALMDFAKKIKDNGGVHPDPKSAPGYKESVDKYKQDWTDTGQDQYWEYDDSMMGAIADWYVLITTIAWLGVKITILAIPMLVLHLPPMFIARLYISTLEDGTNRVRRSKTFYGYFILAFVLSIPAAILIFASLLLDYIVYIIFSVLYCACMCRWSKMLESRAKISPFRSGPFILNKMSDFFICSMGQCARHTVCESLYKIATMWLLIPWLKYYINCNPWIYDLEYRLCQQISTEMKDLGTPKDVADTCRVIISQARQSRKIAERVGLWCFIPHYPYPPGERRWALGMQIGGSTYPAKFALLVHTTHAEPSHGNEHHSFTAWREKNPEANPQDYHYVLSNSVKEPVYRVMLWYNNPFHFFTGWVEASVSNGGKAQGNTKCDGGEHPMWLLTARTRLVSGRKSFTGSGMIDAFFDYWLPLFVHEMRFLRWFTKYQESSYSPWTETGVEWAKNMGYFIRDDGQKWTNDFPEEGKPVSKEQERHLATQTNKSFSQVREGLLRMGFMATMTWTENGIEWVRKTKLLSPQPVVDKNLRHPVTNAQLATISEQLKSTPADIREGMLTLGYAEDNALDVQEAAVKATKMAESKYQEVDSQDGISAPIVDEYDKPKLGRRRYVDEYGNPKDIVSEVERIGKNEYFKCACGPCTKFFMGFSETAFGRQIRKSQMQYDVCRPLLGMQSDEDKFKLRRLASPQCNEGDP